MLVEFYGNHWALFFVEAIIINISQLHNQSILLFCQEMHDKHLNIPAIYIRGHITFSLELCVFYITRNIEVFIWYKNYIIKLGLFEATRVSEQKTVNFVVRFNHWKFRKCCVFKNLALLWFQVLQLNTVPTNDQKNENDNYLLQNASASSCVYEWSENNVVIFDWQPW